MGVWAVSLCFPRRAGRGRGRVGRSHLGVGKFVVFLPLHSPVLEPDLDLALGQAERVSDLDAAAPGQTQNLYIIFHLKIWNLPILQLMEVLTRAKLAPFTGSYLRPPP